MKNGFLEKIENDLFDIAKRLKEIDERYLLIKNKKMDRVEVHTSYDGGDNCTLSVVSPFCNVVDSRLVDYVKKTRVERSSEIFKEIDEENLKIEKRAEENMKEKMRDRLGHFKKILNHYM